MTQGLPAATDLDEMLAIVAYLAFVMAPGAGLAVAIRPAMLRRPILVVAITPAFAYALSYASTEVLARFETGPWPGLAVVNMLAVLVGSVRVGIELRGTRSRPAERPFAGKKGTEARYAHWLLGAAIVLGSVLWLSSGPPTVPMNGDVQNHAYFVTRIVEDNTISPTVVFAEKPAASASAASFYPLAVHSTIAVAHRATNQSVSDLLVAWPLLTAILSFPCGMFELARRLMPGRDVVAGLASLLAAASSEFPYFPMHWGGVPFLIAMSLVPGVIALALEAVDSRERLLFVLSSIAAAGTIFAHTSELAVLAVILGCLAIHDFVSAGRSGSLRGTLRAWSIFVAMCGLLLVPSVAAMLGATSENSSWEVTLDDGVLLALSRLLDGHNQPLIGVLALSGIAVLLLRRGNEALGRMRAVMWSLAIFALLLLSTLLTGPIWESLRLVTVPWYKSWWRLTYNLAILLPLFAAVAVNWARSSLTSSGRFRDRTNLTMVSIAVVLAMSPSVWKALNYGDDPIPTLSTSEVALLNDLKVRLGTDHGAGAGTNEVVLNQSNDLTSWMYPVARVPAFSGMHHFDNTPDRADREYLLTHISEAANNAKVQALLVQWDIRYLLVGETVYGEEWPIISLDRIRATDGFKLLDQRGRYWLFKIPAPRRSI